MALTKNQRYLFCMEEGEDKTWLAKRRCMQGAGIVILLSVSFAVGWIILAGCQVFMPAFLEEVQVNGLVVFGYIFLLIAVAVAAYGIAASICNIFDISSRALGILSGLLVVAPLFLFLIDSGGPSDIIILFVLYFSTFSGVTQSGGTHAIVSRAKQRKKACAAIIDVSNQDDLADIIVQSADDKCVNTAWGRMCAIVATQPNSREKAPLLRIAENAKCSEICSKACGMLEHDWDGCLCVRCGKTRNEQHDWGGCVCKRCNKTRDEEHSWRDCVCIRCGKQHDFDTDKVCTLCGGVLVSEIHETITQLPCTGCPSGSGYGCTGDTSNCIASESCQHFEYETITYIVYPDGEKKRYE